MENLINALSALSLLEWVIVTIVWLVTNGLIYLAFAKWAFSRQWKLYQNLKRPVIVLTPISENGAPLPDGEMKNEITLLKSNGFLNVSSEGADYRAFDPTGKHCVVVLGYRPGMAGLNDILTRIKNNHVPLIVYTYGENAAVHGKDKELFNQYPYMLYANFPLTLLNHIFLTVASYPYDRK